MAVTMLLPGPPDASRNPPFATVAGLGVMMEHEELPDGRFNILLRGEARVRLAELPFAPPFRRARAEELPDLPGLGGATPTTSPPCSAIVATACAASIRKMLREPFPFELPPASSPHAVHQVVSDLLLDPRPAARDPPRASPHRPLPPRHRRPRPAARHRHRPPRRPGPRPQLSRPRAGGPGDDIDTEHGRAAPGFATCLDRTVNTIY